MGWATLHIAALQQGEPVAFRPHGGSMAGKVNSGQLCSVIPKAGRLLQVNDIVLCSVNGRQFLHLIKAIRGDQFQIGNNRGGINGWIGADQIHGVCVDVKD